jgi:hypothetical protein
MNAWSSVRGVARHPVLAFLLISLGVGFVTAAIPPIVDSEVLPLGRPLHGVFMSLGVGLAAILVTAAFVRPGRRRGPRTSQSAVAGPAALVPDCAVLRSDRGDTDLAGDLRCASSGDAVRQLAASVGRGRRNVSAATGAVPTCRGDRIHRIPAASLAGPLPPVEAHLGRGTAVGGMAPARPLR